MSKHDVCAPYWAIAMAVFGLSGLSSIWVDLGSFWNGYILDMAGPAWNYILFRGLFTEEAHNAWTRFFNPHRTVIIFIFVCFGIEMMQYFEVYDSTYDPWDLLAYVSFLVPLYILDLIVSENTEQNEA